MEDLATSEPGDQDNSELGVAAGLPDVLVVSQLRETSVEVSDISSSKHDFAAGLLDAMVVSQNGAASWRRGWGVGVS